ncbi:1,2-phenylacetyl-CoA epoxidase subunit PaaC [Inhella gelatinilytica]|uniref:Phenylacetate-CoA oxygenase subunit PaaC n=1 Tax=Inhella gelatinilytica TaxID=2795030 RepID=A0A931NDZ4_9BURK|nr:1,2-phenylacetyl-CoA epoxidase subunit PaaC [Inhella gelatinilytica]MBH9551961.1 phenylacetate-CoA oxygenase subunit PaaC [Inhella gelatinilytica]
MKLSNTPAQRYVLRIADAALILSQRNAEWCGHGPILEEDLALTNLALDHLGQARALLTLAGKLDGLDEDQLAMLRLEHQFLNPVLFELPHGAHGERDFAFTVLRNLAASVWFGLLWQRLLHSSDAELAAIAEKSAKECRYHLQHATDWTLRLGDGTEVSKAKMQAALERLWPYVGELFEADAIDAEAQASGLGPSWDSLQADWRAQMESVLTAATLQIPKDRPNAHRGRHGQHSEHLGHLLSELQYLQRAYPGGTW